MKKVLLFFMCLYTVQFGWSDEITHLRDVKTYQTLMNNDTVQLIDVRTADEFNAGTIGKAQNIDYLSEDFKDKLASLDKDEPVYVFCRSGNRSEKARHIMLDLGFKEVYDLQGGYNAWQQWEATKEQK
ncbi:rhodanese-like domain-containing protein [Wohlfahrtiimonas larvae]|uniref:Rhodanese domain-containing protein n=1 Tax=Wohlfahrtiimonas larvae TaxID=1157986 RepID=A0ABP9MC18_9GAMM|nr:rhodanese-like domain-containing protein [Wohlfahrtiimonas larvae]